jgi:hypothetical protein
MSTSPRGGSTTDVVKEQVSQGAQQVQQTASQAAQTATQQAESFADSRKNQAAQSLQTVAATLRKSGQELDTNGEKMAGTVIDKVAGGTDSVATYLQNESVAQMMSDVENFARGNTWAFLGGAFVLGLAAARFLKSSTPPPPSPSRPGSRAGYPYGYGSPGYSGGTGYQGLPGGSGLYGGTGTAGTYGSTQREGQYGGFISGQTGETLGTPATVDNYGSGLTEGNDGTTR